MSGNEYCVPRIPLFPLLPFQGEEEVVILKVASGDMLMKNLQNTVFFFIVPSCNVVRGRFFRGGCSPKYNSE